MPVSPRLPTTPASLAPLVVDAMAGAPDARLRELLASLVVHLHGFVIEHAVTEREFEAALGFITAIGQATTPVKNEVVLAADLLGLSTLVALLNNPAAGGAESAAALLGPFWRADAPLLAAGASIAGPGTAGAPLDVTGVVRGADGQALVGAIVDVWQADPKGLYENQDSTQPDMNLRGRFVTDAEGRYLLRSVMPAGYPVPIDGPCGDLLRAQRRSEFRPAHLHFMVSAAAHRVLVTQVFPQGTEHLGDDPVFGVTAALVGHFRAGEGRTGHVLEQDFALLAGSPVFPHPPIP